MIDSKDFPKASLFCEYAYIVNFDTGKLECYRGFQTFRHKRGRYASADGIVPYEGADPYYGCKLVKTFNLVKIPKTWMKVLLAAVERDDNKRFEREKKRDAKRGKPEAVDNSVW